MKTNKDKFWSRYGKELWDATDFQKALTRLPVITAEGPWICGGAVRRLAIDAAQESDYDFFFANADQLAAFTSSMEELGAKRLYENDFNITWKVLATEALPELKVQAIRVAYFTTIEAVLDSFDYSLCQCGYDGESLYFGEFTLFDLANKRLIPGKISYGVSSLRRLLKYTRQGYRVCGGGLANMLEQIVADPSIIQSKVQYLD